MKTNKPNLDERTVDFNGREIRVSNWWSWKMDGAADLYLDGKHLDITFYTPEAKTQYMVKVHLGDKITWKPTLIQRK